MITITLDEEKINFLMRLLHVIEDRIKPFVFSQKDNEGKHIFSLKEYNSYKEFIGNIYNQLPEIVNEKRNEFGLPIIKENVE